MAPPRPGSIPGALALALLAPTRALACLNDFDIYTAEQQLSGAYAMAHPPAGPDLPISAVAAGLGGLALVWAIARLARAA